MAMLYARWATGEKSWTTAQVCRIFAAAPFTSRGDMRVEQPVGEKGSLKWMQRLLKDRQTVLTNAIRDAAALPEEWDVNWRSPLEEDQWAEYRDSAFLARIGLSHLAVGLAGFWPDRGPQWDALGISSDGGVVLVEAKSHLTELRSSCTASPDSLTIIERSLIACREQLGAPLDRDWSRGYYQYANRLAHLNFLRERNIEARLVFVYFVGDTAMNGPASAEAWNQQLMPVYDSLGIPGDLTQRGVLNVFLDVRGLS
jgi:hypothetical protein